MTRAVDRRRFLAAVGAVSVAGCLGSGGTTGSGDPTIEVQSSQRAKGAGGSGPPTASERLPLPLAPAEIRERSQSGGPGKDGIPSIDDPSFVEAEEAATALDPGDPVFGVAGGKGGKAYPQSILVWHEVCNDVVDGTPVSVTYCPLTGTAMGFFRGETTFGISGRLVNNNLIMYDRGTETWWPQVLATAVPGPWNEDPATESLAEFRVVWTTWERWRSAYPETLVLSRETGLARNYDRDPYGGYNPPSGYYSAEASPMFPPLSESDALPPKRVVIGARTSAGAVAFEKDRLRREKVIAGELGGQPVVAVYDLRLDTGYVYRNRDGRSLGFRNGGVVDGEGVRHAPRDLPGERILAFDAMWFAWSGFYPETSLYA